MPPLSITCRNRPADCRCLCRGPQKKFVIPHVPDGYKRVLVPSPGAKCGAREYIIVRELLQQRPPRAVNNKNNKPSPPPLKLAKRPTLDAIPEVPNGYTRVLVPLPGTKCGERDYIVVCKKHGELLDQDYHGEAVLTAPAAKKNHPPPSAPTRKKIGRRIGMREKILPFELHDQIIQYSHDHANWTKALMRDYPPEFFLYARTITRKSNFLHRAMGECASRLGCGIKTIVEEEDGSVVDHLELSDEESNRPTDWHHGVEQGHQEDEDDSSVGSDITFVEEDNVQEDVVVHSAVGVPVAASTTTTTVSSTPAGQTQQDGTHVFAADSSCHPHDLLLLLDAVNNDHHVSQLQDEQQEGSGYYIDDKGRKRRFSLRIMAKKSASTKTE